MKSAMNPVRRTIRRRAAAVAAALALAAPLAVSSASNAIAAETDLFVASAKEMTGLARTNELVRLPVVFDDSDGVTSPDNLVVYDGAAPLVAQPANIDRFASGNVHGVNLYVYDDFAADEEKIYRVVESTAPPAVTIPDVTVTETASTVAVQGVDVGLTFTKGGTTPGAISAINSSLVEVAVTSGVAGPQASLGLSDIVSRTMNDDFETGTSAPSGWTGTVRSGTPTLSWATSAHKGGTHAAQITAPVGAGNSAYWESARLAAVPASRFRLEGFIKGTSLVADSASTVGGARLGMRFYNASGALITESYSTPTASVRWVEIATGNVTAPAGTASVSMVARLDGSGTAFYDLLTFSRSEGTNSAMANTSATQRNVAVEVQTGPLFATVTVTNQLVRSSAPVEAYQISEYLVPQHGDYFSQQTNYRGSLSESTHGVEAVSIQPMKGKIALGGDGGADDGLVAYSDSLSSPAFNSADVKKAVVDVTDGVALVPVGSSISTIRRVDYSASELRVVGADFPGTLENIEMQVYGNVQRHFVRYVFSDDVTAEGLRVLGIRNANPIVGIVDRADASFDDDLVPLIKSACDLLLEPTAGAVAWNTAAMCAYINAEVTGLASYTAKGNSLVNGWITPDKQTVAYWEAKFAAGYDILDSEMSSLYYLAYFNDDERIWKVAHAVGQAAVNTMSFSDSYGNPQLVANGPNLSIRNMILNTVPTYLWGAMRAGDTTTETYLLEVLGQPAMGNYVHSLESPYEIVKDGVYRAAEELVVPLYYGADASYFGNIETITGGALSYTNRAARVGYTGVEIDDDEIGTSATGWTDAELVHPTSGPRWMTWNYYMLSVKSVLDTATDDRTGVTTGARWLQRYLDIAALPVTDDRAGHQLPLYINPAVSAEFNKRSWGTSIPPANEQSGGNGMSNTLRHITDAYMIREHAADID